MPATSQPAGGEDASSEGQGRGSNVVSTALPSGEPAQLCPPRHTPGVPWLAGSASPSKASPTPDITGQIRPLPWPGLYPAFLDPVTQGLCVLGSTGR